jgi:hypothetical protein
LREGWNSQRWRTPKTGAGVSFRESQVDEWLAQVQAASSFAERHAELRARLAWLGDQPVSAVINLSCRANNRQHAIAYADAIARVCGGVVVSGVFELLARYERGASAPSASLIEAAWREHDQACEIEEEEERSRYLRAAAADPDAYREANDWSDVMPD